jgi:nitrogen fixation NifU-like protein
MSIHEQGLEGDGGADDLGDEIPEEAGAELGDLEALRGVVKFPVRIKCATLSWNTFDEGVSTPPDAN